MGLKEDILKQVELMVEAAVQQHCDGLVEQVTKKLAELIPGKIDDVAFAAALPELQKVAKEYLLAQANKIDGDPA